MRCWLPANSSSNWLAARGVPCIVVQVVVEMVQNKLGEEAVQRNGWLLDGYPRRWSAADRLSSKCRRVHSAGICAKRAYTQ